MKTTVIFIFCVCWAVCGVVAPPVTSSSTKSPNDIESNEAQNELNVEYDRYLKEVVQALESDPQFREKLQKAEDADIRSGKIAHELEYVSHAVRTRLDEVKRSEMERLRKYTKKAHDLQQGLDTEHLGIHSIPDQEHIDDTNPETFEIEDLRRLIAKTTKDLAEADKQRREEFKEYEMQKEFEKHEAMKKMNEDEKKTFETQNHDLEEKHKKHAPLHHPISKPQLEEVWEKSDHMENQEFDPKTFFYLHDVNGDGVWDFDEVKALFLKELDKMYQAGAPEDDMRERVEEMERMREHVFSEADVNRDGLISYEEFLAQTQKKDFNSDPGWETLDQQQVYTPEEYHKFEMQRQHEIEQMIADGRLPPHFQQQGHPQGHPQQFQAPPQGHPQQFQAPPQGHPQQFQAPPQGHPQQFQAPPQGHPQQFQAPPQGQPQQFQAPPQGQPQQFQAPPQGHPQQFQAPHQGQPQQFQAPPQGQPQQFQAPPQGQPQQFQAPPQGHPQQFQAPHQGQPQQFQAPPQGQPQQFQAPPQGQPQQFQAPPQGQPQQFQAPPQGHPQQFHAPPQGQPQQFQAPTQGQQQQYRAQAAPPVQNQPPQPQGSSESHIASQQAASVHQPGQQQALPQVAKQV